MLSWLLQSGIVSTPHSTCCREGPRSFAGIAPFDELCRWMVTSTKTSRGPFLEEQKKIKLVTILQGTSAPARREHHAPCIISGQLHESASSLPLTLCILAPSRLARCVPLSQHRDEYGTEAGEGQGGRTTAVMLANHQVKHEFGSVSVLKNWHWGETVRTWSLSFVAAMLLLAVRPCSTSGIISLSSSVL